MAIRDDGLGARRFSENLETFTSDGTRVSRGTFLQRFLAGAGASHAGISYDIRVASSNRIQGPAAFAAPRGTGDPGDGESGGDGGSTPPPTASGNPASAPALTDIYVSDSRRSDTRRPGPRI